MLQYIVKSRSEEEIMREAREAIDGGCRWIEIKAPESVPDEKLKPLLKDLIEEVHKEEGVLIVADRVTLCKDAGCDGVQLYRNDLPLSAARTELEASPIIGLTVDSWEEILRQYRLDVDFFRYEPVFTEGADNLSVLREMALRMKENDVEKPLAAAGGINSGNLREVLDAGAVGIAVDSSVAAGGETVTEAVRSIIRLLGRD